MPESPAIGADGPISVTVLSNGRAVQEAAALLSVRVEQGLNAIPAARLVYVDGDPAGDGFPLSESKEFAPGARIEIRAGYSRGESTLFSGVVVRQRLEISSADGPRFAVECLDPAVTLTERRRSATYVDRTDREVLESLIREAGLAADVQFAGTPHPVLVQYDCSDWDFLLARAEACGLAVRVADGKVSVGEAGSGAGAVLSVRYGVDLIAFDAEIAASAADAARRGQRPAASDERTQGTMRFQGSAKAVPGALIELAGLGSRFDGSVLIAGVRHEIADGQWTTEVRFGRPGPLRRADAARPASSPPGMPGLHVGQVVGVAGDPAGGHRVQVTVPMLGSATQWARLATFHASDGAGALFLPEVGDEVVLGFFGAEPAQPVVLGSLYSLSRRPPEEPAPDNNLKALVTRSGLRVEFDDRDQVATIRTPAGNRCVLSDKDRHLLLQDPHGNTCRLDATGITLESPKDIVLRAEGGVTIDAVGAIAIGSRADVSTRGLNVSCRAEVGFMARGAATAELSASGQTTVQGAMVMIN